MSSLCSRIVGIIFLFVVAAHASYGQPTVGPRLDHYGDALPEGALARLGTLRLTHLGVIEAVAISPDGKVAASGVRDGKETYLGERIVHQSEGFTLGEGVRVTEATIRLWNVKTGELLRQISTPDAPVSHMSFTADGKVIYAGCGKFLCCWECATGKKVWQQEAVIGGRFHYGIHLKDLIQAGDTLVSLHEGKIICPVEANGGVSFHNHPQWVVRFWNGKTGALLPLPGRLQSTISPQTRAPILLHGVALTPDLKRAAIAVSEGEPLPRDGKQPSSRDDVWKYPNSRVELIELATSKVLLSIPNPDGEFGKISVSADGNMVATLTGKTIVTPFNENGTTGYIIDSSKDLWFTSVAKKTKRVLEKGLSGIEGLQFVGKDKIATLDSNAKVSVWRLDTGASVDNHQVRPESFWRECAAGVLVKPWQNTVRLFDVKSDQLLHAFDGHRATPSLRFAIHSKDTLISRDGEHAVFWDARFWQQKQAIPLPKDEENRFFSYYWFHDPEFDHGISIEKGLYAAKGERGLELRDIKTGKTVRQFDDKGDNSYYFSPAGNRLLCDALGLQAIFDIETGKKLAKSGDPKIALHSWSRNSEFSTQGKYFAKSATEERPAIRLYDADTGKLLRKLSPKIVDDNGSILMFKFSRDEELVFGEVHAAGPLEKGFSSERVSITIWHAKTGEELQDIVLSPALHVFWREALSRPLVQALAISHDHRLVALARTTGRSYEPRFESTPIEIWEVASGLKRGELTGHGPIADLAFSPDDRCLASSSDDTTILIWGLNRPLQPLKRGKRRTEKELDDCWRALFEGDAKKADGAIWKLIDSPAESLAYLRKKIQPVPIPDADRVRRLLTDLESEDFKTRTRADEELAKYGGLIRTQIDRALKEANNLEAQRRLKALAEKALAASRPFNSLTNVGEWRALEVAEKIARPEAIELLRDLANGAPDGQLTIAAKAALTRTEARTKALR
jgi:WD40 repeat protein